MSSIQKLTRAASKTNPYIGVTVRAGRFNIVDCRPNERGQLVTTTIESDLTGLELSDRLRHYADHAYDLPA